MCLIEMLHSLLLPCYPLFMTLSMYRTMFMLCYGRQGMSLVAQTVKNLPAVQETQVRSLGWEPGFPGEGTGNPLYYSFFLVN